MKLGPLESFCYFVDTVNERTGNIAKWLLLALALIVFYDVVLRYVFNKPTIWSWDINVQLNAAAAALGGGYVLLHNGHVSVDFLSVKFSRKTKVVVEFITFLLFLFCIGLMFWLGTERASESVLAGERYSSFWSPPLYFLRVITALGLLLLLLQGISNFIRNFLPSRGSRVK